MTSVSSDDMAQPDDMAGSAERLSPEALSPERTPVADTSDDAVDTAEEEEGICGRTEGCSPTPADEPTPSSAEEGKPDGGKKKGRLRQGLINFKRKLFPRKKGSKLKEEGKNGGQKSKSASNVLQEVEQDPAKIERAMSVDSVYPAEQNTNSHHGMNVAQSLEALNMVAGCVGGQS
ncbi:hypothetical protein LSAT2_003198 [Lamellibrachia satsuma]|nr:hypothetical protein LSAT2_003198 [Lamellibrachia satsuma]